MSDNLATTDEPATAAMPELIKSALDAIERERTRILTLIPMTIVCCEAVQAFRHLMPHANVAGVNNATWLNIHVQAASEIADVRRFLAKRGYHIIGKPDDYPSEHRRTYDLALKDAAPGTGTIILNVYFTGGERAVCKYVQVGEKTVPVMKLVCDGDDA